MQHRLIDTIIGDPTGQSAVGFAAVGQRERHLRQAVRGQLLRRIG